MKPLRLFVIVKEPSARADSWRKRALGVFSPSAFARPRPLAVPETWYCTVTVARDVEFRHERVTSIDTVEFALSDFLVDGKLPTPAT